MYAMANAIITVTRGTTLNASGDEVPASTVVYQGPASISESSNAFMDKATQTPRTVRTLEMLVPSNAGIQSQDYVLDTIRGVRYVVTDTSRSYGLLFSPDQVCNLKRVN